MFYNVNGASRFLQFGLGKNLVDPVEFLPYGRLLLTDVNTEELLVLRGFA
jgi:hypothetical protein